MGAAKTLLTALEFDNYPFEEDKRYKLDEGELIEMKRPAYKYNRVLMKLTKELYRFFDRNPIGELLNSENLYASSPNTRRAPDIATIPGDRSQELRDAKMIPIIPEITVEVLSPSETTCMIHRKLKQYFAAGVKKEMWLVDPEAREVEIWTGPSLPEPVLADAGAFKSKFLPGFELPLQKLFD
jgi:Uma2 family endonuclease